LKRLVARDIIAPRRNNSAHLRRPWRATTIFPARRRRSPAIAQTFEKLTFFSYLLRSDDSSTIADGHLLSPGENVPLTVPRFEVGSSLVGGLEHARQLTDRSSRRPAELGHVAATAAGSGLSQTRRTGQSKSLHGKLFKRSPLRAAIDKQEQVDGDSVAENKTTSSVPQHPFITSKSCDYFRSPVWREGMNADCDDHSQ
jgi:hypothetical protein